MQAPLAELSRYLLVLYQLVGEVPPEAFQREALRRLQVILPFDSAAWGHGVGSAGGSVVHAFHIYDQPPQMMIDYERIKHHDVLAFELVRNMGRTLNVSPTVTRQPPNVHPDMIAHLERYGMIHTLGTIVADPVVGLFTALSFYRADPARPFDEEQRAFKEAVTPHLAEAWSANRFRFLERAQGHGSATCAQAICDRAGWLHNADAGLGALVRAEWPTWTGPKIPSEWIGYLTPGSSRRVRGAQVLMTIEPLTDLFLLKVRKRQSIDSLSPRELEVATRFGSGDDYRAIAARLEISPATVRNHLRAVYAKLGVTNKVQLAKLLAEG